MSGKVEKCIVSKINTTFQTLHFNQYWIMFWLDSLDEWENENNFNARVVLFEFLYLIYIKIPFYIW